MNAKTPGQLDRSAAPGHGAPKPFKAPTIERRELPLGVQLLSVMDTTVPLLQLEWVIPAGAQLDRPELAGRATLTASMLDEGTERYTGPEISDRIEQLGGSLDGSADWEATYASCAAMSWFLSDALELLGEIVLRPVFPAQEVERIRRRRLAGLRQRLDRPDALASDWLASLVYAGTPYSVPLVGTSDAVAALRPDQLQSFHRESLMPSGSAIVAIGDFEPDRLAEKLTASLRDVGPFDAPRPQPVEIDPPARNDGPEVWIVDRPGASQTEFRYAHPGPPRRHPDWPALRLLNGLLGGKFTSRLMLSLRERHGITYGVSSRFVARRGPGPFVIACAVASEGAGIAAHEVCAEIERLRNEPPPETEVQESADYLIGVLPQHFQGVEQIAEQIAAIYTFDLGLDYLERYPDEVRAVGPADILAAAQRHLHPEQAIILAVGPAADLRPQLEGIGAIHVVSGHPTQS